MAGADERDPSITELGLTRRQSAALFAAKSNLWRTLDDCSPKPDVDAFPGALTVVCDRIQRCGGAVDFNCAPRGDATFKAALPHLTFTT